MKLAILDDYQRLALEYADWESLKGVEVVVFDEPLQDPAKQLAPFDIVCLMRERTPFGRALVDRLPNLKFVSLTGDKRSHTMPEVPTLKELGIDVVAHAWWGILAPAGTPKPIIDKLVAELNKAIKLPDVNKMLTDTQGMDVVALSPEATQKWIVDNMARWGKVVRDNNIKLE